MTEQEILEKVNSLKYKDEYIKLTNVYPSMLEKIFDFNNGIEILGGRDLDYSGETLDYEINGSAYYGTCTFYKKHGRKKTIKEKTIDVYTRKSFEFNGRLIENIPPAIECKKEELDNLLKNNELSLFYICFNQCCICRMIPFFAKQRIDVIHRALSIWGSYDELKTKGDVEKLQEKYNKDFDRSYKITDKYYVLM